MRWDFSGQEKGNIKKNLVVSFAAIDAAYRQDIQSTLSLFMDAHKELEKKKASSSQVKNWKEGLVNVRKILGSSDWASISDDNVYRKFKSSLKTHIKEAGWTKGPINQILRAINMLIASNLCARKPDGAEFLSLAKDSQQHIAIPIGIYQPIIAKAIDIVETYHPHRRAISEVQSLVEEIFREEQARTDVKPSSLRNRARERFRAIQHSIPNFKLAKEAADINKILSGCAIVALAFSGVRISELQSMNKHSYEEKGANGIPIIKGEETKRNGVVIQVTWQTHRVVKDALELAYDATQYLRDIYESRNNDNLNSGEITPETHNLHMRQIASAFLNSKHQNVKRLYCKSHTDRMFKGFLADAGIAATQADVEEFNRLNPSREGQLTLGGALPKLTPHDFRRSFAVFFKRYGFGSSATIKFQYKHRNINMSDYYSNNARLQAMEDMLLDNDLLSLMNEEGIRMGVDIFDEIYNESEQLGGAGGERIAKDKFERLSSGEQVYMTRGEIERLVRNGTLSVVKLPTGGYCTNATCSRVCGIGEFTTEIKPCEHQVITDNQARVILNQNRRIIKAFREMNTGDPMMNSILIGQKQKIKRNEQMIKEFNLSFEPFDDKIKGIIETAGV